MNRTALQILKRVAKNGDMAVGEVLKMAPRKHGDHRDQYPLATLIEEEYLGISVTHTHPEGTEKMREFSLAIMLHIDSLPKAADGGVEYRGIRPSGGISPEWNRVFLKAKGALYLTERVEKRTERLFALLIAVISASLAAWFTS